MLKKVTLTVTMLILLFTWSCFVSAQARAKEAVQADRAVEENDEEEVEVEKRVAEKGDMSMEIRYGIRGSVKRGRNLPIQVTVTNNGGDFSGKLQIYFKENQTYNRYQKDVMLASGETKEISFVLPTRYMQPNIRVSLADEKKKELLSEKCRIGSMSNQTSSLYIGVLTDASDRMSYLRRDDNRVFFLKNEELPNEASYLEALDVLVINDYHTGSLSPEQYKAIQGWVESGGTLVIGTGNAGGKVWEVFKDDFITGTMGEVQTAEVRLDPDSKGGEGNPRDVLSMELKDANAIYEENGYELVWLIEKEKGNVLVFATDLGVDNADGYSLGGNYRTMIVENVSETKKRQLNQEMNMGYDENNYMFREMLRGLNDNKLPNVNQYAVVLAFYVILVGPVLYFTLKKTDKRKYLWTGMASLSACFALIIYLMGYGTRIHDPYMGYVGYLKLNPSGGGTEEVYSSVTFPYNGTYRLEFEQTALVQGCDGDYYIEDPYDTDDKSKDLTGYDESFDFTGNGTVVELKDVGAFHNKSFLSKKEYRSEGGYDCDIRYEDGTMKGSFTNNLGYDLTDVLLYSNRIMVYLGDVANGETAQITDNCKKGTYVTSGKYMGNGNSFLEDVFQYTYWDYNFSFDEGARKYLSYDEYLTKVTSEGETGAFFMGTTSQKSEVVTNKKVKTEGLQIALMPFELNYSSSEGVFLPSIDSYSVGGEGGYDGFNNRYIYDENVILTYQFGAGRLESLSYMEEYNLELSDPTSNIGWFGVISAYNWETEKYDPIFTQPAPMDSKALSPYMNEDNMLTLKYTPDSVKMNQYTITLPYLSAVMK